MTEPLRDDPSPPSVPDHEVFGCIGEGSYGRVWLARTVLGAWRAVKVVHRDVFQSVASYDREFSGLRRFEPLSRSHPGFVDILHSGEDPGRGCFHYVMELADDASIQDPGTVAGRTVIDPARYRPRTLSSDLRILGRLPPAECVRIGCMLAGALARLHQENLIHRDIKPSNIVFVGGEPKLADIGLVIEVAEARSFVGTEGYVAPEGPNSPQSDLYSLGMVLYEAAMGMDRCHFPSPGAAMRDGPDAAALRELNAVLLRACATRREDRYESAAAMAADLEWLRSGRSVQERQRRQRLLQTATRVGVVLVAMAVFLGLGLELWNRWTARQVAVRVAHARQLEGEGVRSLMSDDLGAAAVRFAESLPDWINQPQAAGLQRIRLRQILNQSPRPLTSIHTGSAVSSVAFSPDGQRLVTSESAGTVSLWDADSGHLLKRFSGADGASDVEFSPDGRRLWVVPSLNSLPLRRINSHRVLVLDGTTLEPAGADVRDVEIGVFSPDGRSFAVVSAGSSDIRILDAQSGAVRLVLRGHLTGIGSLAFSPDGRLLASGGVGTDKSIHLWDTRDGKALVRRFPAGEDVKRIVFRPHGDQILVTTASGFSNLGVSIFDLSGPGKDLLVNRGIENLAGTDAMGAGGRRFLVFDEPHGLSVRSFDDGQKVLSSLQLPSGQCVSACVGPDGVSVVVGSDDGWVRVWDLASGAPRTLPMQLGARVYALAFSPDATRLVTGTHQGLVRIWDLTAPSADAEPVRLKGQLLPSPHPRFRYPATLVTDDTFAAITEVDGATVVQTVDLASGRSTRIADFGGILPAGSMVPGHRAHLWASFNLLMSGAPGWSDVVLARRSTQGWRSLRLGHPLPVGDIRFTPDDSRMVSIDREARIRVWRTDDGSMERAVTLPHPESAEMVLIPRLSPDAQFALWTDHPSRSHLFYTRWNGGAPVVHKHPFKPSVNGYSVHPTAPLVAVRTADHHIHVLDLERGLEIPLPGSQGTPVLATLTKWSPTSRCLLVEAENGPLQLFDFERSITLPVPGPQGGVTSGYYDFSPDGRWLVAASADGRVWAADAVSGEPVTPWLSHPDSVRFVGINSQSRLLTLDGRGVLRAWDLKPSERPISELQDRARQLSGRSWGVNGLEWLPPEALVRLLPPSSKVPPSEAAGWHRVRAGEADSIPRWEAARFHARQWTALDPGAESVAASTRLAGLAIPPRDPQSPETALDLSAFYTHSFGMLPRGEYDRLPRGPVILEGIPFDLRGLIRLEPPEFGALLRAEANIPHGSFAIRTVSGIPVGRPVRRIHFLQALDGRFRAAGEECARWRIRFADGSQREFPLIFGRHFPTASRPVVPPTQPNAPPFIVWSDPQPSSVTREAAYLCRITWDNPEPNNSIHALDFTAGAGRSRAVVVAISVE